MSEASVQLDHVAVGVPAISGVARLIGGTLGGRPRGAGPGRGFRWCQWEFEGGGALEVLEPAGPADGFLHRFLAQRGPGVHHATFKVPDIRIALDHAKALGFHVVGFDDSQPSWLEAFLHPKSTPGLVVQIVEAHPEKEDSEDLEFP
jgi:methylmalonyl-CoA/ethylmalonyl-CoA epimerase